LVRQERLSGSCQTESHRQNGSPHCGSDQTPSGRAIRHDPGTLADPRLRCRRPRRRRSPCCTYRRPRSSAPAKSGVPTSFAGHDSAGWNRNRTRRCAQRLNALRGHRRIEELLNRPPRLEVRVARWQCAVEVFAGIGRVRGLASHVPNRQRHRPGEFALHVEAPLPDIPLLAVRFQPPDGDWRPCQRTRVVSPNRGIDPARGCKPEPPKFPLPTLIFNLRGS